MEVQGGPPTIVISGGTWGPHLELELITFITLLITRRGPPCMFLYQISKETNSLKKGCSSYHICHHLHHDFWLNFLQPNNSRATPAPKEIKAFLRDYLPPFFLNKDLLGPYFFWGEVAVEWVGPLGFTPLASLISGNAQPCQAIVAAKTKPNT